MSVVKIVELVGKSVKSWDDAVQCAVSEAAKTLRHIGGVEVLNWTADIDEMGRITEYKANVKVAFKVDN